MFFFVFQLRYKLPLVVSGDGSSVDMFFFHDTTRDIVSKAADVLLAENYSFVSTVSSEIADLTGK